MTWNLGKVTKFICFVQTHRPMLVYFVPDGASTQARWLEEGRRNAERLVAAWEKLMRPVAFVGTTWRWGFSANDASTGRPRPGGLFFATNSGSLLRYRNFQSLDSDLAHLIHDGRDLLLASVA